MKNKARTKLIVLDSSLTYLIEDNYTALAHAIVEYACKDYMKDIKRLHKNPSNYHAKRRIMEEEQFLHSDWFESLTGVDREYFFRQLTSLIAK